MASKAKESGRKSLSPWLTCEKCQSILPQRCTITHESNCPPNLEKWSHDFIRSGILYSTIETYKSLEPPKNIPRRALDDMVFISFSALQLLEIAIADPVLVTAGGNTVVKTVWPCNDISIASSIASVSLTKHGKLKTIAIRS